MADEKEANMQITPETPGQLRVYNPFESPSDYSHLQEHIVSSPTVFKSTKSATPGKFRWSIDKLALINPVEIDSEEICRQSLYLSQARIDTEMEEKRQKAIEEFFTKSVIVPSPWIDHSGKQVSQLNSLNCMDVNYSSPIGREIAVQPGKSNASCQTLLSLPVDFDIEKILGEYFKVDELADQSQESLSSSSLRRKLFLDEDGSLSSGNSSPAPHSSHNVPASLGVLYSIDISPVRCRSPLNTSSSGQFSSSPIQGGKRTYSLGSLSSPSFLERNLANCASPTVSPISIQIRKTPLSEQKHLTFRSPDMPSVSNVFRPAPCGTRSSFAECSPLEHYSPIRTVTCRGGKVYQASLTRLLSTPESPSEKQEEEVDEATANVSPEENPSAVQAKSNLHQLNGDASTYGTHLVVARVALSPDHSEENNQEFAMINDLHNFKESHTVDMYDPDEILDKNSVKGLAENSGMTITGLNFEGSCIYMSPIAESSVTPCENSSLQVDSGYNGQTCSSSLMDTVGAETSCKENDMHLCESQNNFHFFRVKHGKALPRYWTENESAYQSSSSLLETHFSK